MVNQLEPLNMGGGTNKQSVLGEAHMGNNCCYLPHQGSLRHTDMQGAGS